MTEEKNGKTKPKGNKKERRSQKQLNLVKKRGEQIVSIAGAIIILSSLKWSVASQMIQDVFYAITLGSSGLLCECPANAGGKRICKHVFAIHKLLEMDW